ncbi:hypothetical protein HAZT_HAZT000255 [Hyalella azteca]|uniref:PLAT domain-containing protein n=1 Tax=Hyalella azteca TaxID=294128 RepID=A0A6A0GXJ1_HYAAZ|nr:hypothetical protein HAZT_HAZT000255 [Hyalella azteca]
MVFQHKNLGLLSTLRLGHDNYGLSPKWLVEHVLVRNEITGHTWKFPCGRWLGRGIDDGSLERMLVGEMVPGHVSSDDLIQSCRTPPRCRSPNLVGPRRTDGKTGVAEIQQLLGDAVNNLVKFFYKPEKERGGSLTLLLCGDSGLVACLELVFNFGFKSTRFFGKNLYLWDYFERVEQEFQLTLKDEQDRLQLTGLARTDSSAIIKRKFILLIDKINQKTTHLGKDDKFQLFMCISASCCYRCTTARPRLICTTSLPSSATRSSSRNSSTSSLPSPSSTSSWKTPSPGVLITELLAVVGSLTLLFVLLDQL